MNNGTILMCLNIPRGVTDEHFYELFSAAGPIDDIYFGQNGKSVFIVYEFAEAVVTAKEIFRDVKLLGRPIRMYGQNDIEAIYSKRSEQIDLKRRREMEIGPPAKHRRFSEFPGPSNHHDDGFNQSSDPSWSRRNHRVDHNFAPDRTPRERNPEGFHPRENPYLVASRNSYRSRSDLIPDTKKTHFESPEAPPGVTRDEYEKERAIDSPSRNDHAEHIRSEHGSNHPGGSFRTHNPYKWARKDCSSNWIDYEMENPYNKPVSRNEEYPSDGKISFEMENPYAKSASRNERREYSRHDDYHDDSSREQGHQQNRDRYHDRDPREYNRSRDYRPNLAPRNQYRHQKHQNQSYKSRRY